MMNKKEGIIEESDRMKRNLGILFIILAAFCFALMGLFVRLAGELPTYEKAFFRNAVAVVVALLMLIRSGEGFHIGKGNTKYLLIRAIAGTVGILCNFYAVDKLNIADASMLNKLSPFFAVIFSVLVLKEKTKPYEIMAVVIAFIGALFVIKPTFHITSLAAWIGAFGGLGAGLAYTYVRKLGSRGVKSPMIVFFFSAFSCICMIPPILIHFEPISWIQLLMLFFAGCAATGGQFSITIAYTKAPAKDISVFDYSQIIFSAMLGFIVLNQLPDRYSFIGYAIIIGVAVLKWFIQNKKAVKRTE